MMNRLGIAAVALLASLVPALAQQANVVPTCGSITYTGTGPRPITQDANGQQCTTSGSGGAGAAQVQGNSAAAATDTGNPVKVGARYDASLPTYTDGQRTNLQTSATGSLNVQLMAPNVPLSIVSTSTDGVAAIGTAQTLSTVSKNWLFNGTTFDRQRGDTQGTWSNNSYTAAAGVAATPVATGAAANNLVLKASAGNLYNVQASNHTATAGYLVVLNATSAPADGAITPLHCQALPANGNASIAFTAPLRYSTGVTAVLTSAATCFTKTTGVITGFISGVAQ